MCACLCACMAVSVSDSVQDAHICDYDFALCVLWRSNDYGH
jgi:hypothetical protein